ncbi:NADH-FMN oxidoreductase RutF, flavin reductase (DIM6/NTAB) family [Rhodococcus koreensis]|uniref:NADH-FMN oxidoreductase RutF, flavin reductase (DIM6/NTAB) family n=2 Tax=Rhodococcus koreensis TaxID=99653 RepID=A0A1H5ES58_9NOCA|nr:NADH-FMN oxidoreductase RutF, flavin reductase (DIM6/NTAB) family [Rhodococcus koreensis]
MPQLGSALHSMADERLTVEIVDDDKQREKNEMKTADSTLFRRTISRFASGVTVITTSHGGTNQGMTASAVTALSLNPPMLVLCVNREAPTHEAISTADSFVVNVLSKSQEPLARQFSRPSDDKFAGVETYTSALGLPVITGCLANFECSVTARTTGGTHTIFIADVRAAAAYDERKPLLYYAGRFGRLVLAEDDLRDLNRLEKAESGWTSDWFRMA